MQKQVHLKTITIISYTHLQEHLDALLTSILQFPSIREIQLFLPSHDLFWEKNWSVLLNASNLEILGITTRKFRTSDDPYDTFLGMRNEKLTSLSFGMNVSIDNKYIIPFLETFPNVKDLWLSHVDKFRFHSICENQVKK